MLTNKGVQTLLRVEQLMDEAGRRMSEAGPAAQSTPPTAGNRPPAPTPRTVPGRADGKVGSVAVR
jgi:hypothetical protein